ncbi:Gfo/Idh/MocA family oxidoreductase [Vagococcus sp. BWB3-3]|uniref:Gfo/Idh/MocA family oxidoreductase n=1 Tax=Vagococcus allomyrinae TaxID=2794353 RepID=A0A940PE35_9ENTE|nr:Gfo/Idh/MocA family oxidoreductase [Vagococcus allomyrinae]MBP1043135.1 Gfo/Idh/MocA family oxidoreductase [Vagococcus allomyrinae]
MTTTLKIGMIGTGSIAHEHIQAYQKMDNVELVAFCDINPSQLNHMADRYGISETYSSKEALLANADIDAVSVCTWNAAHAECAIAALNAGKHVLCEKPMATSVADALAMEAAAKKNGKLLMIGFVRRFGNDAQIVTDFRDKDFFGEIYYGKATYLRRNGNPGGWFGDKSRSGGGPLIDLGVHVIDLLNYLMGQPKPISVYGATFQKLFNRPDSKDTVAYSSSTTDEKDICDVEDLASAMIRFADGSVVSIEASFSLNLKEDQGKIELFGTKGGASLAPQLELYTDINGYMTDIQLKTPTALDMNGLFYNEVAHFVDCVLNNTECLTPAADGVTIMRILDAIYQSAETGHEVMI